MKFKFLREQDETLVPLDVLDAMPPRIERIPELVENHFISLGFDGLIDFYNTTIQYITNNHQNLEEDDYKQIVGYQVDFDVLLDSLHFRMNEETLTLCRQLESLIEIHYPEIYDVFDYTISELYIQMKYFNYQPTLADINPRRKHKGYWTGGLIQENL